MVIITLKDRDGNHIDCCMDSEVYAELTAQGYTFSLSRWKNSKPYVRISRYIGYHIREWHLLHRWILKDQLQPDFVVHHRNYQTDPFASTWNLRSDLQVMPRNEHTKLHHQQKRSR